MFYKFNSKIIVQHPETAIQYLLQNKFDRAIIDKISPI